MADSLASLLAGAVDGSSPLSPEILQAVHNEQARNIVADPANWQGQGLWGGLARTIAGALAPSNTDIVRNITTQRQAAQPDLAKLLANDDSYSAIAANPSQFNPVARAQILAGATPASAADARLRAAQAAMFRAKAAFANSANGAVPPMYGDSATANAAAPPLPAGGGAGDTAPNLNNPADLVGHFESEGLANKLGISPYSIGFGGSNLANAPLDPYGFPIWSGKPGPQGISHAAGRYQFEPATWAQYAPSVGVSDFSPASQDKVFQAAFADKGYGHWAPYNPSLALAISRGAGRGAPARSGGSMAPQGAAPAQSAGDDAGQPAEPVITERTNPALAAQINAAPASGTPVPLDGVAQLAAAGGSPYAAIGQPGVKVNSKGMPYSASLETMSLQEKANVAASMAAIKQAQLSGTPRNRPLAPGALDGVDTTGSAGAGPAAAIAALAAAGRTQPALAGGTAASVPQQGALVPGAPRPISPAFIDWAQKRANAAAVLGEQAPGYVNEAAALPFVGPKAAAEAAAKQPYTWNTLRPGQIGGFGGNMTVAAPERVDSVDAEGNVRPAFVTPPLPGAANGTQGMSAGVAQLANAGNGNAPVTRLGPGVEAGLKARAEKEQTDRQLVITEANAAQQQRATLMSMANEAGNFVQGPFAAHAQAAARILNAINPAWGDQQVASYQDFVKNAGALTRQAVREVSSRAAVQEFNMIGQSLPSPDLSTHGLQLVQNEMIGLTDYKLAKAQAQQQWEQVHGGPGNVTGFETAFQKQASPYAFIVARMDAPDRQQMIAKLQSSEQGKQELGRLSQQLQFIKQTGLAQ